MKRNMNSRERSNDGSGILSDQLLRRFLFVGVIGVLGCTIARAPSMLGKLSVPVIGLELNLNAGYFLVFGPMLLLLGILWASAARPSIQHRSATGLTAAAVTTVLPVLSSAFLALQFFLLLAPKGECVQFDRWRYLTDLNLSAFQPEYCMNLAEGTQRSMPWLLNPPILQGWLQIFIPLIGAVSTGFAIRKWVTGE